MSKAAVQPWLVSAMLALFVLLNASGCTSVPKAQLDAYTRSYDKVSATAQDIYLSTKTIAELPSAPGGPAVPDEDARKRRHAIDMRLDALAVIDEYNGLLVALATGEGRESLNHRVRRLGRAVSSLSPKIAGYLGKAVPYGGAIELFLDAVDLAQRTAEFRRVVEAAQPVIPEIIAILRDDADDIRVIREQIVARRLDPHADALREAGNLLEQEAEAFKPDPRISALFARLNAARATAVPIPPGAPMRTLAHRPRQAAAGSAAAAPSDIDDIGLLRLDAIVGRAEGRAAEYAAIRPQIDAYNALIRTYQDSLDDVSVAFTALAREVQRSKASLNDISRLVIVNAPRLRQAYLAYQEARAR